MPRKRRDPHKKRIDGAAGEPRDDADGADGAADHPYPRTRHRIRLQAGCVRHRGSERHHVDTKRIGAENMVRREVRDIGLRKRRFRLTRYRVDQWPDKAKEGRDRENAERQPCFKSGLVSSSTTCQIVDSAHPRYRAEDNPSDCGRHSRIPRHPTPTCSAEHAGLEQCSKLPLKRTRHLNALFSPQPHSTFTTA